MLNCIDKSQFGTHLYIADDTALVRTEFELRLAQATCIACAILVSA